MIQRFSKIILEYLLKSNVIENTDTDKEYYQYGIEITISSLLNIFLILVIGTVTRSFFESIIFLICVIIIRQFTGGFHADTYLKCNLIFCISFIAVLILCYCEIFKYIYINFNNVCLCIYYFIKLSYRTYKQINSKQQKKCS